MMALCLTTIFSSSPPRPVQLHGALRRRSSAFSLIRQKVPRPTSTRTLNGALFISCSVADRNGGKDRTAAAAAAGGGGGEVEPIWAALIPRGVGVGPEKVLRLIAGATSSPICQFIESPRTFLHSVDPRIKLAWLLALVILPARSHIYMRLGLVLYLTVLSIWILPNRIWMIFQSASLCLTTTMPEQIASALRWFMAPLSLLGTPVSEIILTLLLSLRFISLVFDEVRSAALGIIARRICWHQLTLMETLDVFFLYVGRIFKNIFSHAEQISKAMIARGFRGDCDSHKIYLFSDSSLGFVDFLSIFCLLSLIGAAILSEQLLV